MSGSIPIIRNTTCPSLEELADKDKHWAIVYSIDGRGFVGRVGDDSDDDGIILLDPFDYFSKRALSGTEEAPRIAMQRQIFPVDHFYVEEILVKVARVLPLCKLTPRALAAFREDMISGWEGREFLKKNGGNLDVASASTVISAP